MKAIAILSFVIIFFAPDIFYGSSHKAELNRFEFSRAEMGTEFTILLYASDAATATHASRAAFECVEKLDAIMSDYRETSELMTLCRTPCGQWVKVSEDLFRVLERSQELAERTGGAFDVTVGPVVRLWRRARRRGELPDPQSLARAVELTGYGKLSLDKKSRSVRLAIPGMLLDLGGIAKGYAADEAMAVLKRHGIERALIAAGGDIIVSRPPPGSRGWSIGLASHESFDGPPKDYVNLSDAAISTSGAREQYVEVGGIRYSHIINPRTGVGVSDRGSVTVMAKTCADSDSLATAVSVLGVERGLKLIDSVDGAAAKITRATAEGARAFRSKRWDAVFQK